MFQLVRVQQTHNQLGTAVPGLACDACDKQIARADIFTFYLLWC